MNSRVHRVFGRSGWVVVFLVSAAAMLAQQMLDNDAILKLVRTGLSEDLILSIVSNEPGKYSLAADDLARLRDAGVPDKVVAAMIQKQSRVSPDAKTGDLAHTSPPWPPSWINAPVPQWSEENARQLLADSPWVKTVHL